MRTPQELAQEAIQMASKAKNNPETGAAIVHAIVALAGEIALLRRVAERTEENGIKLTSVVLVTRDDDDDEPPF